MSSHNMKDNLSYLFGYLVEPVCLSLFYTGGWSNRDTKNMTPCPASTGLSRFDQLAEFEANKETLLITKGEITQLNISRKVKPL